MQFEQTQQSWPRRELNGADSDSSSSNQNGSQVSLENHFSIPTNKDGKRYTMKETFSAWFNQQEDFSAEVCVPLKNGENYKYAQPQPLYHLDFSHSDNGADEEDEELSGDDSDSRSPIVNDAKPGLERSQAVAPPNLTKTSSFSQAAPVGAVKPVLIQPENIAWVYLDPAGNEQGPFNGDIMQEWLSDGYLSLDLRIRRQEDPNFRTLKSFCEAVQNFIQPFKVPLPPVVPDPVQVPMPLSGPFQVQIGGGDPNVPSENHQSSNNFVSNGPFVNGGPSVGGPHPQSSFGSKLYSQLLPQGGLGAANIRPPSANGLFDFMGPSDYPLINPQYSSGSQFGLDAMNPNLSFSQLHMPSLLHHQQPSLSRTNSGWGMDNSLQGSLPSTPTASATPGPLLGSSGSMSPWINRVQTNMSRVSSPFVPTSTLASDRHEKVEDNLLHEIHTSMVSGILTDEDHTRGLSSDLISGIAPTQTQTQTQPHVSSVNPARDVRSAPVAQSVPELVPEPVQVNSKPKIVSSFETKKVIAKPVDVPPASLPLPEAETANVKPIEKSEPVISEPPSQPVVAPWAVNKEAKQEAPPLTLKQIQELEAERLKREKQLKAEMKQEIALANAIAASKLEDKTPEKVTFNWATSSQAAASAKKSLAEIQREEEAEAAKLRASRGMSGSAAKVSLASTLASIPLRDDVGGAWTTVASKKSVSKKQASTPSSSGISYSSLSGAINPQALRNASSANTPTITLNTQSIKVDFLVWARAAMTNLYPSVSKNELLEVFTTLPLHGDSAQLISETIYSSSATMDGRRFAQEFMKKRQNVEKQIGPSSPESWSSAIISSADRVPTVDDDGWSTSVKSKKKGRRN